ncbi:MAG: hypothetical protein DWQ36_14425 [Acidobacteria bacterium]|nr:MAG: hypothetical protein DWQ30_03160 [Acidobacteriota bacterium]REK06088.1 MAG: hypothetical protein DWQ36_14425 [Acidobacteriota bacterium]
MEKLCTLKPGRLALVALLTVAALVLTAPMALAQEQPPMVRVVTVHTHLGHGPAFEAGMKKIAAAAAKMEKQHLGFVGMLTSQPGSYDLVFPMTGYADIAEQEATTQKLFAELGAQTAEMTAAVKGIDSAIYGWRGDLSFQPEDPRVSQDQAAFTRIVTLRPHLQHQMAFEAVLKKTMETRKKHGINDSIGVWQQMIGPDGPAYVLLVDATSEADFYTNQAKAMEKMGADWAKLMDEVGPFLRGVEYATSVPRMDLMGGGGME